MDWDDIRLFLALARTGRLGSAGKMVGQNATTVSRRLKRLERHLQTTLFEQTLQGYALTESGHLLLDRAQAMEADALGAVQEIGNDRGELSGLIRLSVSEGFGSHVLAPRLASFTAAHPAVTVDLIATSGFLNPSKREVDLAITLSRPDTGPVTVRKLTDYTLGLYARADYFAGSAAPETATDLLDVPMIGYVPDLLYAPELAYLAEVDPRLRASVRSSSINAQAELIAAGAGCGILPCFLAADRPGLVRLLPDSVAIGRSFWLVIHRDVRRSARIERFIAWLDETIAAAADRLVPRGRPVREDDNHSQEC